MNPRIVLVLAALLASAGCGSQPAGDAQQAGATDGAARQATAGSATPEQVRAAQLLSLSGGSSTEQHTGYAGALECTAALALFIQTVEDSPLIDETQAEALRRARGLYEARARSAGLGEGKNRAGVDSDIVKATDDARDNPADASKTAIACIRQLAAEAS